MSMATSNFLVPNATFFVELVAFIVVLGVVGRYVLPPVNRALSERQAQIKSELEAADVAKSEAEAIDQERRQTLEQARLQAREIVEQANRTAEQVGVDSQARATAEYERIVSSADAQVRLARQRAIETAAERIGEMVMEVVERVIGREVDDAAHRDLIDEAIAALNAESSATSS
ncbi:MAG TPA: F0F1 ATP synthase subunit B [Acidimicrobiales bacterium]|nr:F0F1 ATP synthase subunit B [Acidimicrobiales bacterium]